MDKQMNLQWSPEEIAFRDEVRAFLTDRLTPELAEAGRLATSVYPDHHASMAWQAILNQRGWAAPHWPVEHGGTGWSLAQHYIFESERVAAGAPTLSPMGISMVAHVIIRFGTDEQKAYFLPRILSGEVFFCQGYSEPNAGSDLASLGLNARIDGEDLVLNGAKIWTTHAQEANWMFALVRTSKLARPQQGITFLLLEMGSPGVEVRPFTMISGEQVQAAVFFTDVRVPRANMIGEVDHGWTVAKYLLEFERGGSAYAPELMAKVDAIAEAAATVGGRDGRPLTEDPGFSGRLAAARIRVDVLRMLEWRLISDSAQSAGIGAASSIVKVLGTELSQHLTELAMEAAGLHGLAYQPHATRPGGPVPDHTRPDDEYVSGGEWQAVAPLRYMNERAGSIYAGSNEIQRNIIAKQILGL